MKFIKSSILLLCIQWEYGICLGDIDDIVRVGDTVHWSELLCWERIREKFEGAIKLIIYRGIK